MRCCGECVYNERDLDYDLNHSAIIIFYCNNENSDNYGLATTNSGKCPEFERSLMHRSKEGGE